MKKADLQQLIQALNGYERRHLRQILQGRIHEWAYKLFDWMCLSETQTQDPELFRAQLPPEVRFSYIKQTLYQALLHYLRDRATRANADAQILEHIQNFDVLFRRSLLNQALDELNSAQQLIERYEAMEWVVAIARRKNQYLNLFQPTAKGPELYEAFLAVERWADHWVSASLEYLHLQSELGLSICKHKFMPDSKAAEQKDFDTSRTFLSQRAEAMYWGRLGVLATDAGDWAFSLQAVSRMTQICLQHWGSPYFLHRYIINNMAVESWLTYKNLGKDAFCQTVQRFSSFIQKNLRQLDVEDGAYEADYYLLHHELLVEVVQGIPEKSKLKSLSLRTVHAPWYGNKTYDWFSFNQATILSAAWWIASEQEMADTWYQRARQLASFDSNYKMAYELTLLHLISLVELGVVKRYEAALYASRRMALHSSDKTSPNLLRRLLPWIEQTWQTRQALNHKRGRVIEPFPAQIQQIYDQYSAQNGHLLTYIPLDSVIAMRYNRFG